MNSLGLKRPEPEEEKSIISVTVPPLARCDFCRKFDSVCSFCHFRWQKRLEENKQLLLKKFASVIVDPVTRWKILASLISQTDLRDFVGLMCRSGTVNLDILAVFEAGTHAKSLVHVAAQYNKWDMLRVLLEANAAFRRDAMDELPRIPAHIFVDNPIVAPQYERHVLMLKAHSLRQARDHEKAIEIYVKTLESCPWYEHAWCSWIKALLEMRSYDRAWEQIIKAEHASNNGSIAWMDLDINTLVYLREECQREYHEWSHTLTPYESIKPCGCIIIPNRFRIPIKKQTIPSSVISLLVSFCECETLYYLCRALSHDENWVTACEQGALQVDSSMTRVLSTDPHAASLRDLLIKDFRAKVGCDHLHGAVTTMVQAVADSFRAFLICVEVRLISGGEHERVRNEKFVKHFNLFRKTHDEEWSISSAGEWEATNSSAF